MIGTAQYVYFFGQVYQDADGTSGLHDIHKLTMSGMSPRFFLSFYRCLLLFISCFVSIRIEIADYLDFVFFIDLLFSRLSLLTFFFPLSPLFSHA
jgi:hypothetical protein